ncbi:MazG nucleotide pyrophosphohydrolase domain-containing protein [soil metagenome]
MSGTVSAVDLAELQAVIERTYGERDRERGVASSVAWLAEEVGELAQAVRKGNRAEQRHEFADVLAWVASLANQMDIDLTEALQRYANGCPRCGAVPCECA